MEANSFRPVVGITGYVEDVMEHTASRFRLAVQWHPEAGEDDRLFEAFVRACRQTAPAVHPPSETG